MNWRSKRGEKVHCPVCGIINWLVELNCWIIDTDGQMDGWMDDDEWIHTAAGLGTQRGDDPWATPPPLNLSPNQKSSSLLPPSLPSFSILPLMKVIKTDTHRKTMQLQDACLSIQEDIRIEFCTVQSSSGTPRYDKRYLNHPFDIFTTRLLAYGVLRVFTSRCFLGGFSSCCRENEPVRPVCTLHIISKPKHITACLESRACKQKILTFTLTAPTQQRWSETWEQQQQHGSSTSS